MTDVTSFSFLHCADLHLDSPFKGIEAVSPQIAEHLRRASFDALDALVARAIGAEVDFVVFAGDIYDGHDRSLAAQLRLRSALERLAGHGIESFLCHGNHDPLSSWRRGLELPNGAHRFAADEVSCFDVRRGGELVARLYGTSFERRDRAEPPLAGFPERREPPFAIGVLHANVGGQPGHDDYSPCSLDDLAARGIDYWALGHVHRRQVLRSGDPWVVYPGFAQGRSVRELGPGGCYRVEVSPAGVRLHFERLDSVTWMLDEVDASGAESVEELLDRALEVREARRLHIPGAEDAAHRRPVIQRLRLAGRTRLAGELAHADLRRQLLEALRDGEEERSDFVWVESLEVRTRPLVDLDARRQEEDYVGELLRAAERLRQREDAAAELRLRLAARPEAQLVASRIDALADDDLLALLDEAETLAYDLLES